MAGRLNSKMKSKRSVKQVNDKMKDEEYDTSVLQKPITTSVSSLSKAFKLLQTGTNEIREYLLNECDILYECRVCRSIFRSIANFIMHKRLFCKEKYNPVSYPKWSKDDDYNLDIIQKECASSTEVIKNETEENKSAKKSLSSIIDGLTQKRQFRFELDKISISNDYEDRKNKTATADLKSNKTLELEEIEGSSSGVFQTLKTPDIIESKPEEMKREVMELHTLLQGQSVVLGPDGKVLNINQKQTSSSHSLDDDAVLLTCKKCNVNFTTRKTYISHFKLKHEDSQLVYPCLECSDTFSTVWSVNRHLYNIHQKTLPQVRKMRNQIQAKAFRRGEVPTNSNTERDKLNHDLNEQQKIDEENQAWMDNFETDLDMQMCGGCGRRFERKAALNSHSQTCQKRIAARNLININKQKRIAASEEKIVEKRNAKTLKLDPEAEKKYHDKQKMQVAKKRRIGIQIRCDYTKATEKTVPSPAPSQASEETTEALIEKKQQALLLNVEPSSRCSSKTTFTSNHIDTDFTVNTNVDLTNDLLESEVVSIPSSNSSPNKEEQDPLSTGDIQSDVTDSEIEEILGPDPDTTEFVNHEHENYEYNEKEDEPMEKVTNESTLKLIRLINSDITTADNDKPTLDDKMSDHINFKKMQCISCNLKFNNISKLRCHMALHFNWMRYRCDICSFKAYDKINVYEHIKEIHNIHEWEKIEAVILQIPEWETVEISSDTYIPIPSIETVGFPSAEVAAVTIIDEKNDLESAGSITPNSCILVEPEDKTLIAKSFKNRSRPTKKYKAAKTNKVKKKIEEVINSDINTKDPLSETQTESCNQSENERSVSRSSSVQTESTTSQDLKKMVYEVIFGQDATLSKTNSSSSPGEEKDNSVHVVPSDVSNVVSRPVRNRVKPINKDFIYDLHAFKEQAKPVFPSNNSRSLINSVNKISESLEDLQSSKKSISKKRLKKPEKNCNAESLDHLDNTVQKLNLQKSSIDIFPSSDNQSLAGDEVFSSESVTVVDPKAFLNDSNTSQSDGEDDDIYIVENEELVALKF